MKIISIVGIVIMFHWFLSYSDPFEGNFNQYGQPFLIFTNPSLMVTQTGHPAAAQVSYLSPEKIVEYKGAAIIPFGKNAFSLGYIRAENPENRVYSAYSIKQNFLYFGSSFSVAFLPINPSLTVDAAVSFQVFTNRYISVVYNNLIGSSDTILDIYTPRFSVSASGPFPYFQNLGFDFSYYLNFYEYKRPGMKNGGRFFLRGRLSHTFLHYSVGIDVFSDEMNIISERIEAGLGCVIKLSDLGAGIFTGFHYDLSDEDIGVYSKIYLNTTMFKDRTAPLAELKAVCNSEAGRSGVYISIKCSDGTQISSGIKNWTLLICNSPSREGKIYRSFSGGDVPPSTVHWDYRDNTGKIYDNDKFYLRMIISDKNNNITATPWQIVYPCE